MIQRRDIEPAKMKEFCDRSVGQQAFNIWRRGLTPLDLNQMRVTVSGRQLDEAQTVAMRVQPHGLAIYGDGVTPVQPIRQIAFVQVIGHSTPRVLRNR